MPLIIAAMILGSVFGCVASLLHGASFVGVFAGYWAGGTVGVVLAAAANVAVALARRPDDAEEPSAIAVQA
ncbi:MAG: hypothetical protein AAFR44_10950 [Pseudomonadota bacterium]